MIFNSPRVLHAGCFVSNFCNPLTLGAVRANFHQMADELPYSYENSALHERRERVFLILAGFFLGSMAMLNIVGITRFVHIGPLALAVGVLPYPLTFLCTDFISELYGRRRANFVVWVGLALNLFVIGILWLGNQLPAVPPEQQPPWQVIPLREGAEITLANGDVVTGELVLFNAIYACSAGAVMASMVAYMAAQFCDVAMFHFWKRLTKGKHLWLRNNGSTMISQLVDATMVIFITFRVQFFAGEIRFSELAVLIGSNYLFKVVIAALDTLPFYVGVHYLSRYLKLDSHREHAL